MATPVPGAMSSATHDPETTSNSNQEPIVQYIVVRTDLKWNSGAMVAQACHASVASITTTMHAQPTKDYLNDLNNMHKIVLKAENADQLIALESELKNASVSSHLWIEKPENVPTCLAVSPQPRSLVQAFFSNLKLLR